jgi:ABC-2 type transport system permease protein
MNAVLLRKLLRDIRLPLVVVALLLCAFECLWAKITQRITEEILPTVTQHLPLEVLMDVVFKGPGQLIQTLMGGEMIDLTRARDVLTIGYVHPLVQTILAVWAVGRASGAIAGEIDRGTMELLLAQPLARVRVVLAHFAVDLVTIPLLSASMWAGTWLGVAIFGQIDGTSSGARGALHIDPMFLLPALPNVAVLLFALSGITMWLSAAGRFRVRVMGAAVLLTLLQFLVNVIGQLWDAVAPLRPFTVFYYYQPQQILLQHRWTVDLAQPWRLSGHLPVNVIAVLAAVGVVGYAGALWTFCRRDLPAPL